MDSNGPQRHHDDLMKIDVITQLSVVDYLAIPGRRSRHVWKELLKETIGDPVVFNTAPVPRVVPALVVIKDRVYIPNKRRWEWSEVPFSEIAAIYIKRGIYKRLTLITKDGSTHTTRRMSRANTDLAVDFLRHYRSSIPSSAARDFGAAEPYRSGFDNSSSYPPMMKMPGDLSGIGIAGVSTEPAIGQRNYFSLNGAEFTSRELPARIKFRFSEKSEWARTALNACPLPDSSPSSKAWFTEIDPSVTGDVEIRVDIPDGIIIKDETDLNFREPGNFYGSYTYITRFVLEEKGWTSAMTRKFLGDPTDFLYYYIPQVRRVQKSKEWQDWMRELIEKRIDSAPHLAAKRIAMMADNRSRPYGSYEVPFVQYTKLMFYIPRYEVDSRKYTTIDWEI